MILSNLLLTWIPEFGYAGIVVYRYDSAGIIRTDSEVTIIYSTNYHCYYTLKPESDFKPINKSNVNFFNRQLSLYYKT